MCRRTPYPVSSLPALPVHNQGIKKVSPHGLGAGAGAPTTKSMASSSDKGVIQRVAATKCLLAPSAVVSILWQCSSRSKYNSTRCEGVYPSGTPDVLPDTCSVPELVSFCFCWCAFWYMHRLGAWVALGLGGAQLVGVRGSPVLSKIDLVVVKLVDVRLVRCASAHLGSLDGAWRVLSRGVVTVALGRRGRRD